MSTCVNCGFHVEDDGSLSLEICPPLVCIDDDSDDCQGLGLSLGCGIHIDDEGRLDIVRPFQSQVAADSYIASGGVCPIAGNDTEACTERIEACWRNDTDCTVRVVPNVDLSAEITQKPHDPITNPAVLWDYSLNGGPWTGLTGQPLLTQHSRTDSAQSAFTSIFTGLGAEVAPGGRYCFGIRTRFINLDGSFLNTIAVGVRVQAFGAGV